MKIYIVYGACGEYSDRVEWAVCAYTNYADAREHILSAEKWAAAWEAQCKEQYGFIEGDPPEGSNLLDPNMRTSYTGTHYYCGECELRESFTAPEILQ